MHLRSPRPKAAATAATKDQFPNPATSFHITARMRLT